MDAVLKVKNVETGRRLVEAIAVTAFVKPEQTAQDQPDRCFVRDYSYISVLVGDDDLTNHRQGACQHADSGFSALRCERERICLPGTIFLSELFLHFLARHPFPVPVTDLAQTVLRDGSQSMRPGNDLGRIDGAVQGTGVDRDDVVICQPLGETLCLGVALLGKKYICRA